MARTIAVIALVFALTFLNTENARADVGTTVQTLYSNCSDTALRPADAFDNGFCTGLVAGIGAMMNWQECPEQPGTTPTRGAMLRAFTNWAAKHPEAWSKSQIDGVVASLRETWPCVREFRE